MWLLGLLACLSCDTGAVGVEDCRRIERARCTAAQSCGLIDDVEGCQRFYRDQCLHGLPAEAPNSRSVDECVAAIEAAGVECAAQQASAPDGCASTSLAPSSALADACAVVTSPEDSAACLFLTPGAEPSSGGSSGAGEAGAGDGAAGEAGASGTGRTSAG